MLLNGRAELLAVAPTLCPADFRSAAVVLHERWLIDRALELGMVPGCGMALVAVGGLGRRELLPYSDLDLVLIHDQADPQLLSSVADGLWYPLWDAHVKLDHSVRTPEQTLAVAGEDITAALGLLDGRYIAGDADLSLRVLAALHQQWRSGIRNRLDELAEQAATRWEQSGEIAHRVEPDLKHGRGGLRDLQLLDALAAAQLINRAPGLSARLPGGGLPRAHQLLLDVRTELHLVAGRAREVLQAQDADEIAATLSLGDRFDLARNLSDAARTVSYSVDVGLRTARAALPRRGLATLRRPPVRRPLDEGVVEHAGEIGLAKGVRPGDDPALVLRVALASARTGLPISGATLSSLANSATANSATASSGAASLPVWGKQMLAELVALLGTGRSVIAAIEALDRADLWCGLLPEWTAVRDLQPRDPAHVWAVDRHQMETVAYAGSLSTQVSRPDLLLIGALIHDIGKGSRGDHSIVGAELAVQIGTRLGLGGADVAVLSSMVRHHLLLPVTAVRRDLNDPATVAAVMEAVEGDGVLLELLHALAEADSRATGPGMWGSWKSSLLAELVSRCRLLTRGEALPTPEAVEPEHQRLAADGGLHVTMTPPTRDKPMVVTVIAPNGPNVLSCAAGVLALHSLQVHSADVRAHGDSAVDSFAVSPKFGRPPELALLRQDCARALRSESELAERLRTKEHAYGEQASAAAPVRVLWFDPVGGPGTGTVVMELRTSDRTGLLYRVASALQKQSVRIGWARVETLGSSVLDVFGLDLGENDTEQRRAELSAAVLIAVGE